MVLSIRSSEAADPAGFVRVKFQVVWVAVPVAVEPSGPCSMTGCPIGTFLSPGFATKGRPVVPAPTATVWVKVWPLIVTATVYLGLAASSKAFIGIPTTIRRSRVLNTLMSLKSVPSSPSSSGTFAGFSSMASSGATIAATLALNAAVVGLFTVTLALVPSTLPTWSVHLKVAAFPTRAGSRGTGVAVRVTEPVAGKVVGPVTVTAAAASGTSVIVAFALVWVATTDTASVWET